MRRIQILGSGCQKCGTLAANAEAAAKELGFDIKVEKVTDIEEIMDFGVMNTPALLVDGKVRSLGKALSVEEIKNLIANAGDNTSGQAR